MTHAEAQQRIGQLIKFNPRDGRQTWIHAELLEVKGDKAHIAPAHAKDKTKWVPLETCRCWKARDAQVGISDPTIERIVIENAAKFTADKVAGKHKGDRFIDYTDRPALWPSSHAINSLVVRSDVIDGAPVGPAINDNAPTACIICEAPSDHLDDDGLCPQCSEEYNRKADETPEQIYTAPASEPSQQGDGDMGGECPPSPRPFAWYIVDLPTHSFFNGLRFVGITDPEGLRFAKQYSRSQDAHRARTVAANNRDLASVYVIEQAQAEALIKSRVAAAVPPAIGQSLDALIQTVRDCKAEVERHENELITARCKLAEAREALSEFKRRIDDALSL